MIELDGQGLPGSDHKVSVVGEIKRSDLSGGNTSTAAGHEGWKAFELRVDLKIKFINPEEMMALRKLFHAREGTGKSPKIFEISGDLPNALVITRVQFAHHLKINEDAGKKQWLCSVTLAEVKSISENLDQKIDPAKMAGAEPPPGTVEPDGATASPLAGTWFEDVLITANDALGKYVFQEKDS